MDYAKELRRIASCYDALLGRSDKEILLAAAEKIELNAVHETPVPQVHEEREGCVSLLGCG